MVDEIIKSTKEKMEKSIKHLHEEYKGIRSGRANPGLIDGIKIEAYGQKMPLNQVASISVPEPRTLVIDVWDQSVVEIVEKAIQKSELSLNPNRDGKFIRIHLPPLTEERRKEFVKLVKNKSEECKVSIRNVRRDANDSIKALEKKSEISEDESKKQVGEVQKLTDKYIEETTKVADSKEKEIMET